MKKNIIYLLIAGCSLFLGACNDDDTQYLPPVELQITSSTVDFKSVGGDGTIEVGNADPTLTATSNEEWCTIKACSNGVVSFYIAPNDRNGNPYSHHLTGHGRIVCQDRHHTDGYHYKL